MDEIDDWVADLLSELRSISTPLWAYRDQTIVPMPNAIEQAIRKLSDGLSSEHLRPRYERAISKFDQLAADDPSDAVARPASTRLSDLLKRPGDTK